MSEQKLIERYISIEKNERDSEYNYEVLKNIIESMADMRVSYDQFTELANICSSMIDVYKEYVDDQLFDIGVLSSDIDKYISENDKDAKALSVYKECIDSFRVKGYDYVKDLQEFVHELKNSLEKNLK